MERTEEMIQLATRLVAFVIEERSQMNREIGLLREEVAGLRETIASMSVLTAEKYEPVPEPDVTPDDEEDSGPAFEPLAVHEPELEFIYEPEPEPEPVPESESEVLKPRDREEQIKDTSEWGMFFDSNINVSFDDDDTGESIIGSLMDFQEKPADPAWMTDVPGSRVDSVYDALTNNDRMLFIRELFDEDGEQFTLSMDRIDECPDFGQVVKEMRIAFPEWDESSEEVYQFYMMVRRRFC